MITSGFGTLWNFDKKNIVVSKKKKLNYGNLHRNVLLTVYLYIAQTVHRGEMIYTCKMRPQSVERFII